MAGTGKPHLRGEQAVLTVEDLTVEFPVSGGAVVHAVSGISFDLLPGETLGILGESGCGKSSAARAVMQLPPPTSGSVEFKGKDLTEMDRRSVRPARSKMQLIMQDPVSSLNPRRRVKDLVTEGVRIWGHDGDDLAAATRNLLEDVGLDPDSVWDKRPHEMSGGQCQRVCIARAVMMNPDVLICDEPVSSLDVSVQAQILNLLERTKERYNLAMMFIAHDVAVVKNISDRVMVLYLGKVCEVIPSAVLDSEALHPYTRLLLASVPQAQAQVDVDESDAKQKTTELPSPLNPPSGCRFRTRCHLATERCAAEEPQLREIGEGSGRFVACHEV